jgi:hypothetical protein
VPDAPVPCFLAFWQTINLHEHRRYLISYKRKSSLNALATGILSKSSSGTSEPRLAHFLYALRIEPSLTAQTLDPGADPGASLYIFDFLTRHSYCLGFQGPYDNFITTLIIILYPKLSAFHLSAAFASHSIFNPAG